MLRRVVIVLLMAACLAGCGCSSIVSTHRRRIEKICDANSELADISSALDDIAQTMLYAGRIHDPPLADNIAAFINEEHGTLEYVLDHYGPMDGSELSRITHGEDPWKNA